MNQGLLRSLEGFLIAALLFFIVVVTPSKGYGPRFPPFVLALGVTVAIFFVVQAKHLFFGGRGDESSLFDLLMVGVVTLYSCHLLFAFPGIPYSHDLNHYISTIAATKVKLFSWDGLSRWTHMFWCGIPLLRFYSPLLLLSSSILPLDPLQSIKTVLVAVRFASAYVVYFTSGKMLEDRRVGFWASICYVLSGYNLINSHVRGDLAELAALLFVPLAIYSLWKSTKANGLEEKKCWRCLSALFTGFTIVNHVPTGIILCVWMVFWMLWFLPKKTSLRRLALNSVRMLGILVLGVGLSLWFLLPAVLEREFVQMGVMSGMFPWWHTYTNHLVELPHLLTRSFRWDSSPWMPLYLGNVILALALLSLPLLSREKKSRQLLLFLLLTMIFSIFGASSAIRGVIQPLWQVNFTLVNLVRSIMDNVIIFPWRILQVYALSSSILAGYTIAKMASRFNIREKKGRYSGIIVSTLILTLILYDTSPFVGYVGGYTYPHVSPDTLEAIVWTQTQPGFFRIYLANYEGEDYYYVYASGVTPHTIGPGPRPDLRPIGSTKFVDKAIEELEHVRWLNRAGYLSVKYILIDRDDLSRWSQYIDRGRLSIAMEFQRMLVLENKMFRPYAEANMNLEDIGAPRVSGVEVVLDRLRGEEIELNIKGQLNQSCYVTIKENYYPDWRAMVDGEDVEVMTTRNGFIAIHVPSGTRKISLRFKTTAGDMVGIGLSSLSFLIVLTLVPKRIWYDRLIPIKRRVAGRNRKEEDTLK